MAESPLKDEHCDCLNRCLSQNAETAHLIECLQKCGLDVEAFKSDNDAKRDLATNLKRQFFPNRS